MTSEVLDDFVDTSAWMAVASGLAQLALSPETVDGTSAMRLDFDFKGGGGFVVARRPLPRAMPESFALSFRVRGAAPANRLELKLADPSGHNVWWRHWDAFDFPAEWNTVSVRSEEIEFAWGPAGGGSLAELGVVELVIAAGPGGRGTIWIGELRLEDRTYRATPALSASSSLAGHGPERVLDGDAGSNWHSERSAAPQWLLIDFLERRDFGGLVVTWAPAAQPRSFRLETSSDGAVWTTAHAAEPGRVARSYVYLPGASCRLLRLALEPRDGNGCGIAEVAVQPFGFSRSIHEFFEHVARDQRRGLHPRWLSGEQSYWTCAGVADGETCAILNEEGMVEVDRGTFSIEPFLHVDGRLVTWADAEISQSLEDDWMPIPSSTWRAGDLVLRTTAFAARHDGRAVLYLRYRLESDGGRPRRARLFAAIRPFQVNPPWQAFGALGGMRRVEAVTWDGTAVEVDGGRRIVPLTPPSGFGASAFEQGEIATRLATGDLPARDGVTDSFGYASAALAFDLESSAAAHEVFLAIPFGESEASSAAGLSRVDGAAAFAAAVRDWQTRLGLVRLDLTPRAGDAADVARSAVAQVLVNRDGPALQPGPRRYTRAWIRDGAVMAAALHRFGRSEEAVEFVRWYGGHQAADGSVPCCVDRSGPDWLVEHDSHGELIFAVAECYRFIRDRALLVELWPAVSRAVDHLDALRATRLGPEYDAPERRARRGLLPESASHEGYLAHPVHSYWDDFWALRAYADAAEMAAILGDDAAARRMTASHDELGAAIAASIELTLAERHIGYVPGSVEWADFDPTATSAAVSLLGGMEDLPRAALEHTFDEYLAGFRRRRRGEIEWNNYSAYEVRIVGALVHLGRRDDAAELAEFLLADRRPRAWNQWPEISWRDPRSPGHIGDVPHTWIGAEYALSFRTMLVYERQADRALVIGAGIPASWLDAGSRIAVAQLPTYYGLLDLELRREEGGDLVVELGGALDLPPGGFVLRPPLAAPAAAVAVNGEAVEEFQPDGVTVAVCPARVVFRG